MNISLIEQAWPQLAGGEFTQTGFGRSHWTRIVHTKKGSYALRVYSKNTPIEKIQYELAILGKLQSKTLPFSIPVPVPSRQGQFWVSIRNDDKELRAVVWQYISGDNPDASDANIAGEAGQALGQLAQVLGALQNWDDLKICPNPSYRDFLFASNQPDALLQDVPIDDNQKKPLLTLFHELQDQIPEWYQQLPQQIIHNDFLPGNILVERKKVSGVLDFESTHFDLSVLDLVVALCHWPYDVFGTGTEWKLIDALGKGYTKYSSLSPVETRSLPQLFRLRWAMNVQYFVLQHIRGNVPINVLEMFLDGALRNEHWVTKNGDELIQRASEWKSQ